MGLGINWTIVLIETGSGSQVLTLYIKKSIPSCKDLLDYSESVETYFTFTADARASVPRGSNMRTPCERVTTDNIHAHSPNVHTPRRRRGPQRPFQTTPNPPEYPLPVLPPPRLRHPPRPNPRLRPRLTNRLAPIPCRERAQAADDGAGMVFL